MLLEKVVADFWREQQTVTSTRPFLTPDSKIVVAVSGGPDSVALLRALRQLHPPPNLVVGHLNHGWRPSAVNDAAFVRQTAVAWGLSVHTETIDTVALARDNGLSLEEAGRQARYHFLARLADSVGASFIATGHNADDQVETILMHLLRGSGLAGLRGMAPRAPAPGSHGRLLVIRPLLEVTRADIDAYCREHKLTPVIDPSNEDVTFARNRLRHELLPLLVAYSPQLPSRLQQLAEIVAADEAYLAAMAEQAWTAVYQAGDAGWLRLERTGWQSLPLSLRRRVLRQAVAALRPSLRDLTFRAVEQARQVGETGDVGARSDLAGGVTLQVDYNSLLFTAPAATLPRPLPQLPGKEAIPLVVPGQTPLAHGWLLESAWLEPGTLADIRDNRDPWLALVALEGEPELVVRGREPGERFQPLGMNGRSAAVKEVMINQKIPARLRAGWPIVATADHLVWLVGRHLDERTRVTAATRRVLRLHCYRE